jgi:hypothetical protein
MIDTQDTGTLTRYLTSLNRHLRRHGLGETVTSIYPSRREPIVQIYPTDDDTGHLGALVRWLPTLTNPVVTVRAASASDLHLLATGGMDDGTTTGVVALLDGNERDLVEVNAVTTVGAMLPVALLLSLVDVDTAEAPVDDQRVPVTAGSAALR